MRSRTPRILHEILSEARLLYKRNRAEFFSKKIAEGEPKFPAFPPCVAGTFCLSSAGGDWTSESASEAY